MVVRPHSNGPEFDFGRPWTPHGGYNTLCGEVVIIFAPSNHGPEVPIDCYRIWPLEGKGYRSSPAGRPCPAIIGSPSNGTSRLFTAITSWRQLSLSTRSAASVRTSTTALRRRWGQRQMSKQPSRNIKRLGSCRPGLRMCSSFRRTTRPSSPEDRFARCSSMTGSSMGYPSTSATR
jgi:hypothetical protein